MTARKGVPTAFKAAPHSAMKPPPAGGVPHPRRLRPFRVGHPNDLMDLFEFFPDLPRPVRPRAAVPPRRVLRRRVLFGL
jgi:hypothetical protein